jgi:hypothetical protein
MFTLPITLRVTSAVIVTVTPAGMLTLPKSWVPLRVVFDVGDKFAAPVAVNVAGLPEEIVAPLAVAVSVFAPAVGPRVQEPTVAMPWAFVVAVAPVTLPPPDATAKVTVTPANGVAAEMF